MADLLNANEIFQTMYEPKVMNRFYLYIDGIQSYMLRKADRPKLTQERKPIDYINQQRYYKGKSIWEPITMELMDPVVPSAAQSVMEWIRLGHESATGRGGYFDFYAKDIVFNCLGPVGDKVEEWLLKGAFITSAEFGTGDYTSDDPMVINLTLSYNYAILQY
jgi:hypothetical protein